MSAKASLISVERAPGGDHALEVDAARAPEREQARDVAAPVATAEQAPHELAFRQREQHRRGERDRLVDATGTDHHRCAAVPRRPDARLDDRTGPDGVERVVDTDTARQLLHHPDHVVGGRVDHVGGTEALRHLPALGDGIGDDDRRRARDPGALHDRRSPMPPAPATRTVAPFGHARRVEHRTDPGLHRAADDARDVEGRVGVDLDRAGLGRDDVFGEAAEPDPAQHGHALARQRRTPVDERPRADRHGIDATAVLAARAPVARVAHGDRREHDLVARRDRRDTRTDRVDDTRCFVTEHRRRYERDTCRSRAKGRNGTRRSATRAPAPHRRGDLRCRCRRRSRAASPMLRAGLRACAKP